MDEPDEDARVEVELRIRRKSLALAEVVT